jgi:hypothetical protein
LYFLLVFTDVKVSRFRSPSNLIPASLSLMLSLRAKTYKNIKKIINLHRQKYCNTYICHEIDIKVLVGKVNGGGKLAVCIALHGGLNLGLQHPTKPDISKIRMSIATRK